MDEIQENHREDQEGQRDREAPNMVAGGSHPQAMSVPERRETQGMRWADCEDDDGKEEEEREQEKETKQETGQEEMTSEEQPGLEQREESEHERKKEEERRAQEAREEERRS